MTLSEHARTIILLDLEDMSEREIAEVLAEDQTQGPHEVEVLPMSSA